jgi:dihydrofolate synthase/folylpolyglutamate synthase
LSYNEALDYLYSLQRFGVKLGLDNIRQLLARLHHPEHSFPAIHVAGTNGKGSVCAALARTLTETGARTGLYTSPHLHSFTERIQVDGRPVAELDVVDLVQELSRLGRGVPATFFEFTTALALRYFQLRQVDWAVLEVGMGGRLDATNAVIPALSIITPVSVDHAEHLGQTLESIAREKAGIIKPGVPVVVGRQEPDALAVIEAVAAQLQAPLFVAERDFRVVARDDGFDYQGRAMTLEGLRPRLAGRHQYDNLSLALAALELLHPRVSGFDRDVVRKGIEGVQWPGRLEFVPGTPPILLDGAHNPAGARALASFLVDRHYGPLPWAIGLSGLRSPEDVLTPWLPYIAEAYVAEPAVEKAVDAADIADFLRGRKCRAVVCGSPSQALENLCRSWPEAPLAIVAGSLYLVAELRELLLPEKEVLS